MSLIKQNKKTDKSYSAIALIVFHKHLATKSYVLLICSLLC